MPKDTCPRTKWCPFKERRQRMDAHRCQGQKCTGRKRGGNTAMPITTPSHNFPRDVLVRTRRAVKNDKLGSCRRGHVPFFSLCLVLANEVGMLKRWLSRQMKYLPEAFQQDKIKQKGSSRRFLQSKFLSHGSCLWFSDNEIVGLKNCSFWALSRQSQNQANHG